MKRAAMLGLGLLGATVASAQGSSQRHTDLPATVLLAEQGCEPTPYAQSELWRLLQVELSPLGVRAERLPDGDAHAAAQALKPAAALIAIECGPAVDVLVLRVSDAVSGKELVRSVSVADVAQDARPRALALAVVALLESSWSELVGTSTAQPAGSGALPEVVQSALRERLERRLASATATPAPVAHVGTPDVDESPAPFEASIATRVFAGRNTGLLGVQLGYSPAIAGKLHLGLATEALFGRSELSDVMGRIGSMNLYWLTAGVGLAWRSATPPRIEIGPRVYVGYAFADAHADRTGAGASSKSGWVMTTSFACSLRAPLSESIVGPR